MEACRRWWWLVAVVMSGGGVSGWDGDPEQDVCVAEQVHPSGRLCKAAALVGADDFVFRGLRHPSNATLSPPSGVARTVGNVGAWPGLNTQGMSMVRADFEAGGVNPPHVHPRATEIGFVLQGKFYAAFMTSDGSRLYAATLEAGDAMVFPRGLVHFQINVGNGHGVLLGSLNSQNPGTIMLPSTLFASAIPDAVLLRAFHLSHHQLHSLRAKFHST